MKAVCPNNEKHNKFLASAHVVQTWEIDNEGNFLKEVSTDETTHSPNTDDVWTCAICGEEATFQ
jgi:succinate dehydrogenase/fumarate reductase-like Fe-S protein